MNKHLLLMIIMFGMLAIGYVKITDSPRTLEEDKSWVTQK